LPSNVRIGLKCKIVYTIGPGLVAKEKLKSVIIFEKKNVPPAHGPAHYNF
jgi:hypothetical protein